MPARSIRGQFSPSTILPTTAHATTVDLYTSWFDTRGFDAALVVLSIGSFTAPGDTFTLRFQHANDPAYTDADVASLNPWTDPHSGEVLFGAIDLTAADAGRTWQLDYLLGRRFARLWINPAAGNSGSVDFTATAVLGLPNITPA